MKIRVMGLVLVPLVGLGIAACEVDKKEDGRLPKVEVEDGKLPEYDVDAADVKVGTDTQRVVVPDVDITAPDSPDTTRRRQ